MKRIVIVGGVAGGASAAARARRMSEDAEIIMLDRGAYISFANCGLPYHIGGDIQSRDALLLQTPESFKRRFNVEVRLHSDVIAIDREQKQITVRDAQQNTSYLVDYDTLILSPGAAPFIPDVEGISDGRIQTMRNIPDMDRIMRILEQQRPTHATVVGGGFIGLEAAEALRQRGLETTLVELSGQVMAPVDIEMATPLHSELEAHGVDLRLQAGLTKVTATDTGLTLSLSDGSDLDTGIVILAIGVRPETALAKAAGLALGERGGIRVDEQMRTSDPNILAVGDAVEITEWVSGKPALIPLAGPANRQGRIAADNALGAKRAFTKTQGTAVCRVFDLTVAATGMNEKSLRRAGIDYRKVYVHPMDHASYFPGAEQISLKLLFTPDEGKILGAQALGKKGVDKRIDVLAVAQRAGMTVFDLEELELCYAPPYGSAKDPVNLAGFVAANWLRGDTELCFAEELAAITAEQKLLDVRTPAELERVGAFDGAINIPVDELRDRLTELDPTVEYLVACQVGLRGHVAYRMLVNRGFKAKNLTGGFKTWQMFKGCRQATPLVVEGE
ncbi:CoA-disulfide reductase [Corallincola luteus]|uniref:CoA-disulfide reductase n=1 Tax=Corallincola luteus TaxID=1775177 RepID=A0ABY2ARE6_9GAMM|nr:FAD-dependent oxidoreductase [Corallincola luteus]TCI05612.1 CoA-disulfide reductase [Corallincola luteus]